MRGCRVLVGGVLVACGLAVAWEVRAEEKATVAKEAAAAKEDAAKAEPAVRSPLRGAWQVTSMVTGGEATPSANLRRMKLVFGNTTFLLRNGSKTVAKMDYKVDSTAKPATIDITTKDDTSLGIYAFVKGRLRIVWNESGKPRPTSIDEKGDGLLVLIPVGNLLEAVDVKIGKARVVVDDLLYTNTGSPEWSPNGRQLACDGWRAGRGEGMSRAHVLVCDADGKNLKNLGYGTMPSWSPDGKQLVFNGRGVWKMNADGTNRTQIDPSGFAPEWCPKGNKVAYISGGNIVVRDLDNDDTVALLDEPYQSIHYGMSWSKDGQWICFKGYRNDGYDLAIVHAEGQKKGFRTLLTYDSGEPDQNEFGHNFTWNPDGKQVLVPFVATGGKHLQLHLVDVEGKAKPKRLDWQRTDRWYKSPTWTADGREIAYLRTRKTPQ
ncbi:MAG: TIGR03067 domain-containing protein [Pirellulales bacterium]|nr:TIGR03067 domain-containing protein [Pirellulales bacterium]